MASSLRESLDLIRMVRPQAGLAALEYEIAAERASSLGLAEKRVVEAMAALEGQPEDRVAALAEARRRVWEYFVQRELIGFGRHAEVVADLGITPEVLNGLGAVPTRAMK